MKLIIILDYNDTEKMKTPQNEILSKRSKQGVTINLNLALWLANYDFRKSLLGGFGYARRTVKINPSEFDLKINFISIVDQFYFILFYEGRR